MKHMFLHITSKTRDAYNRSVNIPFKLLKKSKKAKVWNTLLLPFYFLTFYSLTFSRRPER